MLNISSLKFIRYVGLIGIVLFLSHVYAFPPSNKSQAIDYWTDHYFYQLHPEMENKTIQKHQTFYKKEWLVIQNLVRTYLSWGVPCGALLDDEELDLDPGPPRYYVDVSLTTAADTIFYARHPELKGRKIRPEETRLKEEWSNIEEAFHYSCI